MNSKTNFKLIKSASQRGKKKPVAYHILFISSFFFCWNLVDQFTDWCKMLYCVWLETIKNLNNSNIVCCCFWYIPWTQNMYRLNARFRISWSNESFFLLYGELFRNVKLKKKLYVKLNKITQFPFRLKFTQKKYKRLVTHFMFHFCLINKK